MASMSGNYRMGLFAKSPVPNWKLGYLFQLAHFSYNSALTRTRSVNIWFDQEVQRIFDMLKAFVSDYLTNSSLHGFRYVRESKTFLGRFAWILLICSAFLAAGLIIARTLHETAQNPFVTTVEQVPVQDIPFPALSTQQVQDAKPWNTFAANVLNNVYFDCFEKSDCERSEVYEEISFVVDHFVGKLFDSLYQGLSDDSQHKLFVKPSYRAKFCDKVEDLLPRGSKLMVALSEYLSQNNYNASVTMGYLAKKFFRLPKANLVANISELFGLELASNLSCYDPSLYHSSVSASVYAWFFTLGSQASEVTLGEVVWSYLSGKYDSTDPWLRTYWNNTLSKALKVDFWNPESEPTTLDIFTFTLDTLHEMPYQEETASSRCGDQDRMSAQGRGPFCSENILFNECCQVEQMMSSNFQEVIKVMKYTLSETTWHVHEKKRTFEIERALNHIGFKVSQKRPLRRYYSPAIPGHRIFDQDEAFETTPKFQYAYSNEGISITFNSAPFMQLFKNTTSMRAAFEELFNVNSSETHTPLHPPTGGHPFGLKAVLQMPAKFPELRGFFMLIHDPKAIPDFKTSPMSLRAGYTYTIAVTPSMITVDGSVDEMDPEDKGCMSAKDDHNLTLFRDYSYANCFYECHLKIVTSKCMCIPWDYPRWSEDFPVCHTVGSNCFLHEMRKGLLPSECSCIKDCESLAYPYTVEKKRTYFNDICNNIPYVGESVWRTLYGTEKNDFDSLFEIRDTVNQVSLVKNYPKVPIVLLGLLWTSLGANLQGPGSGLFVLPGEDGPVCNYPRLPDFPRGQRKQEKSKGVTHGPAGKLWQVPTGNLCYIWNLRLPFFPGGGLGLFTGMSMLSVAELVYWMLLSARRVAAAKAGRPRSGGSGK